MSKRAALTLFATALLMATSAGAAEIVRSFRQQVPVGNVDEISLEFPVGEVRIEAWESSQIDLDVKLACNHQATSRCREAAKGVRLIYNTSGDRFRVEIKNWPKFSTKGLHVQARINVPRELPLRAELGVGELTVTGTANNLTVDLGVGEINITLPKEAIGSVDLDTGVGEANLVAAGRRYQSAGLIARELRWNKGTGQARVTADCGVGEIDVALK
ncbi:MAG TPA: hypothetical protein VGX68_09100 [Thermoanaerobaculia bacterium]|nr:hypothetical protein [Thermoanaerobaculia bacterium]